LALSDGTETFKNNKSQFLNSGILVGQKVFSMRLNPVFTGKRVSLGDVLLDQFEESVVPNFPEFLISEDDLDKWKFLKGKKCVPKTSKSGHDYLYREGSVQFPDDPSKPSRTIITGEGGKSPSRHKHVVKHSKVGLRRLLPVELERLNMFPDNHTEGVPDSKRAFLMGNAVVVGVVERLGRALHKMHFS
jgi:DNA (cytosine-5)-methyltransferase 1